MGRVANRFAEIIETALGPDMMYIRNIVHPGLFRYLNADSLRAALALWTLADAFKQEAPLAPTLKKLLGLTWLEKFRAVTMQSVKSA